MASGKINCPSVFCSVKSDTITISSSITAWSVNPQVPDGYKIVAVTIRNYQSAEMTIGIEVLTNSEISGYARKTTSGSASNRLVEVHTLAVPADHVIEPT